MLVREGRKPGFHHAIQISRNHQVQKHRGFTLVELLVVITVIAVLIGILVPALGKARDTAKKTQCATQLQQVGRALFIYANDHNGWMPTGGSSQFSELWLNPTIDRFRQAGKFASSWVYRDPNNWNTPLASGSGGQATIVPCGLGQLISGRILNATGGTLTEQTKFADAGYLGSIDTLFCPADRDPIQKDYGGVTNLSAKSYWAVKDHWNAGLTYNWTTLYPDTSGPFPGWANSSPVSGTGTINTNDAFIISYAFRAADYSFLTVSGGVETFNVQTNPASASFTSASSNVNIERNSNIGSKSSLCIEVGASFYGSVYMHKGGGNVLWGDGSVRFFQDARYASGYCGTNPQDLSNPGLLNDGTIRVGTGTTFPSYAGGAYEDGVTGSNNWRSFNFALNYSLGYLFAYTDYYNQH